MHARMQCTSNFVLSAAFNSRTVKWLGCASSLSLSLSLSLHSSYPHTAQQSEPLRFDQARQSQGVVHRLRPSLPSPHDLYRISLQGPIMSAHEQHASSGDRTAHHSVRSWLRSLLQKPSDPLADVIAPSTSLTASAVPPGPPSASGADMISFHHTMEDHDQARFLPPPRSFSGGSSTGSLSYDAAARRTIAQPIPTPRLGAARSAQTLSPPPSTGSPPEPSASLQGALVSLGPFQSASLLSRTACIIRDGLARPTAGCARAVPPPRPTSAIHHPPSLGVYPRRSFQRPPWLRLLPLSPRQKKHPSFRWRQLPRGCRPTRAARRPRTFSRSNRIWRQDACIYCISGLSRPARSKFFYNPRLLASLRALRPVIASESRFILRGFIERTAPARGRKDAQGHAQKGQASHLQARSRSWPDPLGIQEEQSRQPRVHPRGPLRTLGCFLQDFPQHLFGA